MRSRPTRRHQAIVLIGHSCLLTAGVWLLIVGMAAIWMVVFLRPPSPAVTVPNVIGMSLEAARQRLEEAGLKHEVAGERYDQSVPEGAVCITIPTPGKRVRQGRRVEVYVSKGPTSVIVPEVEGLSLEMARQRLERAGLRIGSVYRKAARYVEGTVITQNPSAKIKVAPQTAVDLEVSAGPDFGQVKLPDGTKMLFRTVVVQLPEGEGYRQVRVETRCRGLVDTIHDQVHRAGEKVEVDIVAEQGAEVRVYIDERKVFEQSL